MSNLDVADLLSPAEPALAVKYLQRLVRQTGSPPVEVRLDSGGGKGKGVFATLDIEEGQEIFREAPLVRARPALTASGSLRKHGRAELPVLARCRIQSALQQAGAVLGVNSSAGRAEHWPAVTSV